jgi:hypothetical protein
MFAFMKNKVYLCIIIKTSNFLNTKQNKKMEICVNPELNLEQVQMELKNFEVIKRNLLKKIEKYQKNVDFYHSKMNKRDITPEEYYSLENLKNEYSAVLYELKELKGLIIWEF